MGVFHPTLPRPTWVRSHLSFSFPPSLTLQSSSGLSACSLRIPWKGVRPVRRTEALRGNECSLDSPFLRRFKPRGKKRRLREPDSSSYNTSLYARFRRQIVRDVCATLLCVQSGAFAHRNWRKTRLDAHSAGYSSSLWYTAGTSMSANQRAAVLY